MTSLSSGHNRRELTRLAPRLTREGMGGKALLVDLKVTLMRNLYRNKNGEQTKKDRQEKIIPHPYLHSLC